MFYEDGYITNWIALYIAIKHYDDEITIDKSILIAESNNKLLPIKRINSLTQQDINLILRKLRKLPSISKIQKLTKKLQLNKESIRKIFLICKEVGINMVEGVTQEEFNKVIDKYKKGYSIRKIESDTTCSFNKIFDILTKQHIKFRVDVGHNEHGNIEDKDEGIIRIQRIIKAMKTFTVGETVMLKLDSGDKRIKALKGKCKIIFKNDNYMTLEPLRGHSKITVTLSDIIEKKATVLRIRGEKMGV